LVRYRGRPGSQQWTSPAAAVSAAPDTGRGSKDYLVAVQWRPAVTVPTPQRMTPSEALVETLVANGVTEVFGIVGSA